MKRTLILILPLLLLPLTLQAQQSIIRYMVSQMKETWSEGYMYTLGVTTDRTHPHLAYRSENYRICLDAHTTAANVRQTMKQLFDEEFDDASRADHYRTTQGDTLSYTLLYNWPADAPTPNRARVLAVGNHAFNDQDYKGIAILDADAEGLALFASSSERMKLTTPPTDTQFAPIKATLQVLTDSLTTQADSVSYSGKKGNFMLLTGFGSTITKGERLTLSPATEQHYEQLKAAMKACVCWQTTSYYTEYQPMAYLTNGASNEGYAVSYDPATRRLYLLHFHSNQRGELAVPWCWTTCTRYDNQVVEGTEQPLRTSGVKQMPVYRSLQ